MDNGSGACLNHSKGILNLRMSEKLGATVWKRIDGIDRSNDGIKSASKPSRKLQSSLKTQDRTGIIFRNACGMYDISQ
jgi:hypothetical protein